MLLNQNGVPAHDSIDTIITNTSVASTTRADFNNSEINGLEYTSNTKKAKDVNFSLKYTLVYNDGIMSMGCGIGNFNKDNDTLEMRMKIDTPVYKKLMVLKSIKGDSNTYMEGNSNENKIFHYTKGYDPLSALVDFMIGLNGTEIKNAIYDVNIDGEKKSLNIKFDDGYYKITASDGRHASIFSRIKEVDMKFFEMPYTGVFLPKEMIFKIDYRVWFFTKSIKVKALLDKVEKIEFPPKTQDFSDQSQKTY